MHEIRQRNAGSDADRGIRKSASQRYAGSAAKRSASSVS
jgi:hypothetical protein